MTETFQEGQRVGFYRVNYKDKNHIEYGKILSIYSTGIAEIIDKNSQIIHLPLTELKTVNLRVKKLRL